MPDVKGTVTNAFANTDRAVLEVTWEGTHTGPLAGPGGTIPASGTPTASARAAWMSGERAKPEQAAPQVPPQRRAAPAVEGHVVKESEGEGDACIFCARSTGDRFGFSSERKGNGAIMWERWLLPACARCVSGIPLLGKHMKGRLWHVGLSMGPPPVSPPKTSLD